MERGDKVSATEKNLRARENAAYKAGACDAWQFPTQPDPVRQAGEKLRAGGLRGAE